MLSARNLLSRLGVRSGKAVQAVAVSTAVLVLLGAGDPAARFSEVGHQLMCVCGCNQILLECNHVGCPASEGMRNELMASLTRGDSDSLVEQVFVQKYGPTVLSAPTTRGFDRVAYITPLAALFVGVSLLLLLIRAWKNRADPSIAHNLRLIRGAKLERFRDQARTETDL